MGKVFVYVWDIINVSITYDPENTVLLYSKPTSCIHMFITSNLRGFFVS